MTVADVMPRVERGAAWLDANKPGWFNAIDVPRLDISECDRCVLGQLFGSFTDGLNWAKVPATGLGWFQARDAWATDRGFERMALPNGKREDMAVFGLLREAWITVILSRQFESPVSRVLSPGEEEKREEEYARVDGRS